MGAGAQVVAVANAQPRARVTAKVKAFLEVLRQNPGIAHTEAAQLAGYEHARAVAHTIRRKWPDLVADAEVEGRRRLKVSSDEAEQILAEIARDPNHKDRHKAAQDFLKMHGKLSDKLTITLDRTQLNQRLDELLQQMAEQRAVDISAQHASSKQLPEPVSELPPTSSK